MKLFIIGGTGVLGKRVISLLTEQNYEVVCFSRSKENDTHYRDLGVTHRRGNIYDSNEMIELTKDCDGILNLATSIPKKEKFNIKDWKENNRLRIEGTKSLIQAVLKNNLKFYLQNNVTFGYGHRNGNWVDEQNPFVLPVPTALKVPTDVLEIINSAVEIEQIITKNYKDYNLPFIILRFGLFYSYDSFTTKFMFEQIKKRKYPLINKGESYTSLIHVDDAAHAIIKSVQNHQNLIGKTINVCDDSPVQYKELFNFIADMIDAKSPRSVNQFLAKLVAGPYLVNFVQSSIKCRNDLAKSLLSWKPKYPTYQEGIPNELKKLGFI